MRKKEYFIKALMEETGKTEAECELINSVLENHNIIGHNNKDKIKNDFMEKFDLDERAANDLYNTCAGLIVKGIFNRK